MSTINFAGLASGIDTNALIDATSNATRAQKVTPKQTKIDELTKESDALEQLTSKLTTTQKNLKPMTTIQGGVVAKTAASSNESAVTASAVNGALNGTYDLTVSQLAKNATYSFAYDYSSSTDTFATVSDTDPDVDRQMSFTIGTSSPETVTITATSSMTVSGFISAFNSQSTRAQASLVQVGSGQYRVVITTNNTGTETGSIASASRGTSFTGTKAATSTATHDAAANALFTISGIGTTISRPSNKVSDVINGVTFNLLNTGSSKVTVTDDQDTTLATVKKFITSYNDIVTYLSTNNEISTDTSTNDNKNVFASLSKTSTDDAVLSSLRSAIAAARFAGGSTVRILADVGIATQQDGTLLLDETKFKAALSKEPTSVNSLMESLGDKMALTGGTIDQAIRFNGTIDITTNNNETQVTSLNKQITEIQAQIAQKEQQMRSRFAALEATMSRMQAQQQQLTGALAGLN